MEASTASGNRVKRPARRNPEARREQNRIASRNYREKRKQKLALLNQLVDKDRSEPLEPAGQVNIHALATVSSDPPPGESSTNSRALSILNHTAKQAAAAISSRALTSSVTNHGWTESSIYPPPSQPARFPNTAPFAPLPLSRNSVWELPDPSTAFVDGDLTGPFPTAEPSSSSDSSPPIGDSEDEAVLNILESVKSLSDKQKRDLLRHLKREAADDTTTPANILIPNSPPTTIPGSNWVSNHTRVGHPRSRLQDEARRFAQFISQHLTGSLSPAQLSRIYVVEVGFYGALFANCYALGMNNIEPLMVEEGVSPFSLGPETGYHPSQLPVVRGHFGSITPDLQPCDTQLTVGHHPYLDVIPFRKFRENALRCIEQDDGSLDEDQLCVDLTSGGLVCWGSQQNSLGMEAGVPWDLRAWEPQVWFLQKYWHLVGGLEDEMWKCTRWWHQARGQKINL